MCREPVLVFRCRGEVRSDKLNNISWEEHTLSLHFARHNCVLVFFEAFPDVRGHLARQAKTQTSARQIYVEYLSQALSCRAPPPKPQSDADSPMIVGVSAPSARRA